jgi:hypothetical protein
MFEVPTSERQRTNSLRGGHIEGLAFQVRIGAYVTRIRYNQSLRRKLRYSSMQTIAVPATSVG